MDRRASQLALLKIGIIGIVRERERLERERLSSMPGKIRAAKERFTAAHEAAVDRIVAELEKATAETFNLQDEGVAAAKLLPAMVEQSRAEIREITSEFATQTNGPPPGPLPDAAPKSQPPSQASGEQQAQPQPQLGEPQASWQKANGQG